MGFKRNYDISDICGMEFIFRDKIERERERKREREREREREINVLNAIVERIMSESKRGWFKSKKRKEEQNEQ